MPCAHGSGGAPRAPCACLQDPTFAHLWPSQAADPSFLRRICTEVLEKRFGSDATFSLNFNDGLMCEAAKIFLDASIQTTTIIVPARLARRPAAYFAPS